MIRLLLLHSMLQQWSALSFSSPLFRTQRCAFINSRFEHQLFETPSNNDDIADAEGSDLAAQFLKFAKDKNIELKDGDIYDEEDDDFDDVDDNEQEAGDSIEREKKETASVTVEVSAEEGKPKEYKAPSKYPDPKLTAAEVVKVLLNALANNDNPTENKGMEILFAYSSEVSQIKQMEGLTHEEYAAYLKGDDAYKVVFENQGIRIEKEEFSPDGLKAFLTARIQTGFSSSDFTPVNFVLSTGDNSCWLVDSMLIRPSSMKRRRRR